MITALVGVRSLLGERVLTEVGAPVGRRRNTAATAHAPTGVVPVVDTAVNRTLAVPAVVFVPLCTAVQTIADAGLESNDRGRPATTGGATGER